MERLLVIPRHEDAMSKPSVPHATPRTKRDVAEIQGLRGIAIISVLLFHLWDDTFTVGYLGVDIFFVISGYLMCMLLSRHSPLTVANVADFYYRRIKRIVPIYFFVIWLVLMAAVFRFVYPIDYSNLVAETWKPLMFAANVPDSTEDDYFIQSLGAYKFFLHLWSLSVEIQFYLLVPFLMFGLSFVSQPMKAVVVSLLAAFSYWLQVNSESNDEHMSLDSRVWQFLFGFLAFYLQGVDTKRVVEAAPKFPASTPWKHVDLSSAFWRVWSVLLTVVLLAGVSVELFEYKQHNRLLLLAATSLLIARPHGNLLLGNRALVWIGDISYSVYLVHWPMFVLHKYIFLQLYTFERKCPPFVGIGLIVSSIVLGYLIENAYHRLSGWIDGWRRLLLVVGGLYAALFLTAGFLIQAAFELDRNHVLENPLEMAAETIRFWEQRNSTPPLVDPRAIVKMNEQFQYLTWNLVTCKQPQKELLPTNVNMSTVPLLWSCVENNGTGTKNIVVLGNSHARSYYFGLEYAFRGVYKQMAMFGTNCPLLMLDAEVRRGSGYQKSYKRCSQFRKNIFKLLNNWQVPIDIIVVGTNYHRYINYQIRGKRFDPVMKDFRDLYAALGKIAHEVVLVPQVQFETGVFPHSATLHRQILYGKDLSAFRAPLDAELEILPHGRQRLELLECSKCALVDWLQLYCDQRTRTCESIDFRSKFSFFFDSHHVNALGSLKAGEFMRGVYDRWMEERPPSNSTEDRRVEGQRL